MVNGMSLHRHPPRPGTPQADPLGPGTPGSRSPQTRHPLDQAPPRPGTLPDQAPPWEQTPRDQALPPVDRITDACENITLPGGKYP